MSDLFYLIIERSILFDSDRESLMGDRGFPYQVIDRMKFRSCGPYLFENEGPWRNWFCSLPENYINSLKKHNILIPYFDPQENMIHIMPHKFGIKGLPVNIYIPFPYLGKDLTTLVIAESPFKALASCLMGVPAVGLAGISTFSKDRFNMLSDTLNAMGVQNAVMCFDTEIKNDPSFKNYKPNFTKRYDTEFYNYVIAMNLKKSKIDSRIATLKPEWMVNGKVDIDGFLARKLPHEEYKKCIEVAITPNEYRSSWKLSPPHRSFMERRIDAHYYEGPIEEKFNKYFVQNSSGERPISNFTIKVIQTMYDHESKAERLCKLVSAYGTTKVLAIPPSVMGSKKAFQTFCWDYGDFEFKGNDRDLEQLWHYIFINQDGRSVIKLKAFGYEETAKAWFFGNGAYKNDTFYPVDDDGIVWVDDEGYKLPEGMTEFDTPVLDEKESSMLPIKDIVHHMSQILGLGYARIVIGWALGNFFMPEILQVYGKYPFLFLYGKQQAGKSTIANWISSFFGFTQKGISFQDSSVAALSRATSQMSMVPLWFEEYRNKDPKIGNKNNFLRGIYDKTLIIKGTKNPDEIKTYKARSTLIVSGEENPQDAALNSRFLMYSVFRDISNDKEARESYEWLQAQKGSFRTIGHYILVNKKKLWPDIKVNIDGYLKSFEASGRTISDRNKLHMSIVGGVCDVMLGVKSEFSQFIGSMSTLQEVRVRDEQALFRFYEDIYGMICGGKMKAVVIDYQKVNGVNEFYLWFNQAYMEWEIQFKGMRNDIPASKNALMEHLSRENYFMDKKQVRVGGRSTRAFVLNADHPQFPKVLQDLMNEVGRNAA